MRIDTPPSRTTEPRWLTYIVCSFGLYLFVLVWAHFIRFALRHDTLRRDHEQHQMINERLNKRKREDLERVEKVRGYMQRAREKRMANAVQSE
jgi:hypothetical protein